MLQIILTPTALWFKDLDGSMYDKLVKEVALEIHPKGGYCVKGDPMTLYKTLLTLTYTYDVELI